MRKCNDSATALTCHPARDGGWSHSSAPGATGLPPDGHGISVRAAVWRPSAPYGSGIVRNDRDLGGVLQGIIGHDVSSGTNRLITISSRRPAADGSTSLGVRWAISPATIRDADNRVDASCADHLVMVARNGSV